MAILSLKVWRDKGLQSMEVGVREVEGTPLAPECVVTQCNIGLGCLEWTAGHDTPDARDFGEFVGATTHSIGNKN
jgi:hypothetical protein